MVCYVSASILIQRPPHFLDYPGQSQDGWRVTSRGSGAGEIPASVSGVFRPPECFSMSLGVVPGRHLKWVVVSKNTLRGKKFLKKHPAPLAGSWHRPLTSLPRWETVLGLVLTNELRLKKFFQNIKFVSLRVGLVVPSELFTTLQSWLKVTSTSSATPLQTVALFIWTNYSYYNNPPFYT